MKFNSFFSNPKEFFNDFNEGTLEIIKKGVPALVVKIFGLFAALLLSLFLGRTLGVEDFGLIELANRIGFLVMVFTLFGMENIVLKEVSIAFERKNWRHISNSLYTTIKLNGFVSILVISLLFLLVPYLCDVYFNSPSLTLPLRIILIAVFFQTLSKSYVAAINGVRKIWQANLLGKALGLIFVLIIFGIFYFYFEATLLNAAYSYLIAQVIVFIITFFYWLKIKPRSSKAKRVFQWGFIKPASRLLLSTGSGMISASAAIIILGIMETPEEVGLFNLASRLAMLTLVILEVLNSVMAPRIASLYSQNKISELQNLITPVFYFLFFCGLIFILTFIFFGEYLVLLWGNEFRQSYKYLIIISIGQFVNLITGAVSVLLIMSNNERLLSRISSVIMVLSILINVIFIHLYGGFGACIATTLILISENIYKVFIIKNKTGVNLLPSITFLFKR